MNETLCRALLQARLTEEDVATRLQVDPKTVRRWLEGRMPYLRHRWALAALLGADEAGLWPQLRDPWSRTVEVQAVYPRRDAVPREVWLRHFGSAQREIAILNGSALFLAKDQRVLGALADRASAGVQVRICLTDPDAHGVVPGDRLKRGDEPPAHVRRALDLYEPLRANGNVELRLHGNVLYHSIYVADRQLLVSPQVFAIPGERAPVLRLEQAALGSLASEYLEALARIWDAARPSG